MLSIRNPDPRQQPCNLGFFDETSRDLINFLNPTTRPQKHQGLDTHRTQLSIQKPERNADQMHEHQHGMVACGRRV